MNATRRPWAILLLIGGMLFSACASTPATNPPPTTAAPTAFPTPSYVQPSAEFYFGVDLSYVNEMEDCGAVYLEGGVSQDPFELFAAHGANLVRARLWNDPTWTDYSTLDDVKRTFRRAQAAGMATLLDFHYSDTWADPSRQEIPAAWQDIEDEDELAQALYDYTYAVLMELAGEGLMPGFVQIGNETNPGLLKAQGASNDWPRDAKLFQAGIRAVREAGAATGASPQVVLHVAQPENTSWWYQQATQAGITDFDVIGLSYYPQWSSYSIAGMASQVGYLRRTYGKEVMVLEVGYPWTFDAVQETASNILTEVEPGYPASPQGQLQFMHDLSQALISNGGSGVIYWEPAWVSTECYTQWGQGSHWENATFFDFQHDDELLPGIDYMKLDYASAAEPADGVLEAAYGELLAEDASGDAFNQLAELDLVELYATAYDGALSLALTVAGDVNAHSGNYYRLYLDTSEDGAGATNDVGLRPITVAAPYQPEYLLQIQSTAGDALNVDFYTWDGGEWALSAFTGSAAITGGEPSVIELQMPLELLGDPAFVNLAALSAGRLRTLAAADVLGDDAVPADLEAAMRLDAFYRVDLSTP